MQINVPDSCKDGILDACDIAVSHTIKEMRELQNAPPDIQRLAIIGGMVVVAVQGKLASNLEEDATNAPR